MAIKFSCRCGKHLKARETSAGRLTQCPRCGEPVAIPSHTPNHRGTDELPASPTRSGHSGSSRAVDRRTAVEAPSAIRRPMSAPASAPATRCVVEHSPIEAAAGERHALERSPWRPARRTALPTIGDGDIRLRRLPHWWQLCGRQARRAVTFTVSFGLTLGTFPVLLGLGTLLGLATAVWLRLLPETLQSPEGPLAANPFFPAAGVACIVLAGYCASVLNRALAGAARVRGDNGGPIQFGPDAAVIGLAVWLGCFLAGPVVFVALAYVYWSQSGDLVLLDRVILGELLVPAVGCWLVALTIVNAGHSLFEVTPARVVETAWRLGRTGVLVTTGVCVVLAAYAAAIFAAAGLIHQDDATGYLLLISSTAAAVCAAVALLRTMGGAYARWRRAARAAEASHLSWGHARNRWTANCS